jgi:mRNA interferase HigB
MGNSAKKLYICRMRIIAFTALRVFFEKQEYADSEASLRAWYHDAKTAEWKSSNDLKQQYKNASIVGEGRVVFNIKGNTYRLVVAIDYDFQVIFIRFIGTHKQYDKIDAKKI